MDADLEQVEALAHIRMAEHLRLGEVEPPERVELIGTNDAGRPAPATSIRGLRALLTTTRMSALSSSRIRSGVIASMPHPDHNQNVRRQMSRPRRLR
jgi:hypothetical protein